MEKSDLASARRRMQSGNIKTRKRALKALRDAQRRVNNK